MPEDRRVVFITGAGSGLGRDMALAFAAEGYGVAVTGIEGTGETAVEIRRRGGVAVAATLDLREAAAVGRAVAQATSELGDIDVLVNNAAIEGPTAGIADVSPADWGETLAVNLTKRFVATRMPTDPSPGSVSAAKGFAPAAHASSRVTTMSTRTSVDVVVSATRVAQR